MKSKKNKLNKKDIKKWFDNMLTFSAVPLIVFLELLRNGVALDKAAYVLYIAVLNALIDLLKKYKADNK